MSDKTQHEDPTEHEEPERQDGWKSVKEMAEILGVHPNTVYGGVNRGEIPARRIGRRVLIHYPTFKRALCA